MCNVWDTVCAVSDVCNARCDVWYQAEVKVLADGALDAHHVADVALTVVAMVPDATRNVKHGREKGK